MNFQARRQRAEFLRQRGGCRGACHNHGQKLKQGDRLCRKLTRSVAILVLLNIRHCLFSTNGSEVSNLVICKGLSVVQHDVFK